MKITNCKLKKNIQRNSLEFFVFQVTIISAANLLDIQPNTSALFYRKIRWVIVHHLAAESAQIFDGQVELKLFWRARKGKRGWGAAGKVAVFDILKRGDRVYTIVVNDTKSSTLPLVIKRKIAPDSIVYTDHYRSYNAYMDCLDRRC